MKIGIDILGGDYAPASVLDGIFLALSELPDQVSLVAIGPENEINQYFSDKGISSKRVEVVHADETIGMGEHPARAFTNKPNSTIAKGYSLLKSGELQAFAGAGNTGAMMVGAVLSVKPVDGVQRPCILSLLPKLDGGYGILLDVGSNVDCKPDLLIQFAILGSIYAQNVLKINNPKIGLLNIGEEPEKGNQLAQQTHILLKESNELNFIGNIEGRDFWNSKADVIVADGFTGNVALKLAESFYAVYRKSGLSDPYMDRFNYENYGGTPILGINKTVIVGHGISNAVAIKNMILLAHQVELAGLTSKFVKAFQPA
jgi:glycerol-3-phosphate acyltransferase PlsX